MDNKFQYRRKWKVNGVWHYTEWKDCHYSVYENYQMEENRNFGESRKN